MYLIKENESSIVTIYCLQAIGNLGFEGKISNNVNMN